MTSDEYASRCWYLATVWSAIKWSALMIAPVDLVERLWAAAYHKEPLSAAPDFTFDQLNNGRKIIETVELLRAQPTCYDRETHAAMDCIYRIWKARIQNPP